MQQDTHETNTQLLVELRELRQRNTELEALVSNLKETNKILEESEERFRTIANYSVDWECWVSLDGKLMWVNQAVEKFTGYSVEEYLNLPDRLHQIVCEEDRDRVLSHFENGLQKHQSENDVEFQIRRKDGSLKWVSVSYQPMYTDKGECLGIRSSIRDISKRKLTEQALHENEEQFRSVAESSSDAIFISDHNGTILFWNKAAAEMFGYEEKGVLGKPYMMLLPERLREQDQKALQKFFETGMLFNYKKPFETIALRKDGSEFPIEMTFSSWKVQGQYFFSYILRDVTQRKQQEEVLKISEERFRAIAESSPDGILTTDRSGRILYWNKAAEIMYGYTKDEILGKSTDILRPESKHAIINKMRDDFIKEGHTFHIGKTLEGTSVKKDGTEFPTEVSTSCWKVGEQIFFSGIVRDITRRKQSEEALQESEARYRELFDNSKNALVLYEAIDEGRDFIFREFNHAAENIEQLKKEELIGKFLTEAFPGVKEFGLLEVLRRVWKTGKPEDYPVAFYQDERISGWRANYAYKLPSGEIVVIYEDITERKQQEEALRSSEERFRAIAESSPDAIITADSNLKILYWNKAAENIYGYSAEEIVGKSLETIWTREVLADYTMNRAKYVRGELPIHLGRAFEQRCIRKDGKEFSVEVSTSYWKIDNQLFFSGIIRDITQRKQMEEELRRAHDELEKKVKQRTAELRKANEKLTISQEYLKKFAGMLLSVREEERKNISTTLHDELGSMALSVNSKISIAKEECKENNKQATIRALEQAQAALRKAVEDLRRLAVDLRPPNLEIVGLTAALTDYFNVIKKQSALKITFRNDLAKKKIPENMAIVIYRVAQEALTNITKHAKAQKVSVRLYSDKNKVHLDITDDGVGFDVDKVSKRKGKLKIGIEGMRERVESLGGEFMINSALKQGTHLKATLPKK